jgi:hypothetical protein
VRRKSILDAFKEMTGLQDPNSGPSEDILRQKGASDSFGEDAGGGDGDDDDDYGIFAAFDQIDTNFDVHTNHFN